MKKGEVLNLNKGDKAIVDHLGSAIRFQGIDGNDMFMFDFLGRRYCKISAPAIRENILIMRNQFKVLEKSNEKVVLEFIGKTNNKVKKIDMRFTVF